MGQVTGVRISFVYFFTVGWINPRMQVGRNVATTVLQELPQWAVAMRLRGYRVINRVGRNDTEPIQYALSGKLMPYRAGGCRVAREIGTPIKFFLRVDDNHQMRALFDLERCHRCWMRRL